MMPIMVNAVSSLSKGAAGLSCIQGNIYPELVVWICDNYDKIERAEDVKIVQQFFVDTMDVIHDVYPINAEI